jgi:predicted nucleic acid-binding protein
VRSRRSGGAAQRLQALAGIAILDVTKDAEALARDLLERGPLPKKAAVDALHIAVATTHGMDYLLTWNCTHIGFAADAASNH